MKKLISFAVAGMFALSLAACGSSSSAAASITESSAESTAASTADSAAADSDLAYLQNKGKMTIGYTVYEPMNYTDESGTFTGFDTELATAVCEKLGVEPDFVEINWDTKETELAAKSIDCIWNGLTLTDDREANMACTKPYVKNAQVVVMKADADYTSTADLAGKTVVAESGSAGETTIEEDEGLQQADFVAKSVQTDCLMEVAAGTADAAVLDLTLASAMIGEGTDYANLVIKDELNVEEYGAAFQRRRQFPDLVLVRRVFLIGRLAAGAAGNRNRGAAAGRFSGIAGAGIDVRGNAVFHQSGLQAAAGRAGIGALSAVRRAESLVRLETLPGETYGHEDRRDGDCAARRRADYPGRMNWPIRNAVAQAGKSRRSGRSRTRRSTPIS